MDHAAFDVPEVFSQGNLCTLQRMLDNIGHIFHNQEAPKLCLFQQGLANMLVLHDGKNLHHDGRKDNNAHAPQHALLKRNHRFQYQMVKL